MKKTSTFTDKKPETSANPDPVRQPNDTERLTKADEWERTELEEIRKRYLGFGCYFILLHLISAKETVLNQS